MTPNNLTQSSVDYMSKDVNPKLDALIVETII